MAVISFRPPLGSLSSGDDAQDAQMNGGASP